MWILNMVRKATCFRRQKYLNDGRDAYKIKVMNNFGFENAEIAASMIIRCIV